MTVMGQPSHRRDVPREIRWPGRPPSWREELFGALPYFGAIIIVPVVPLLIYLVARPASLYVRTQAAQALDVTLTMLLYAVSGAIPGVLLALVNAAAALAVMIPIGLIGWGIMVKHLVRGAAAARNGEFYEMPAWICSPFIR